MGLKLAEPAYETHARDVVRIEGCGGTKAMDSSTGSNGGGYGDVQRGQDGSPPKPPCFCSTPTHDPSMEEESRKGRGFDVHRGIRCEILGHFPA